MFNKKYNFWPVVKLEDKRVIRKHSDLRKAEKLYSPFNQYRVRVKSNLYKIVDRFGKHITVFISKLLKLKSL